jgi:hypothetical protein
MKGLLMKLSAFDTLSVCFHIVENPVNKQEVMVSSALALIQSGHKKGLHGNGSPLLLTPN